MNIPVVDRRQETRHGVKVLLPQFSEIAQELGTDSRGSPDIDH